MRLFVQWSYGLPEEQWPVLIVGFPQVAVFRVRTGAAVSTAHRQPVRSVTALLAVASHANVYNVKRGGIAFLPLHFWRSGKCDLGGSYLSERESRLG